MDFTSIFILVIVVLGIFLALSIFHNKKLSQWSRLRQGVCVLLSVGMLMVLAISHTTAIIVTTLLMELVLVFYLIVSFHKDGAKGKRK